MNKPPAHLQARDLLPLLVFIQTHLDDDLALERLAQQANLSPFYFHRLFTQAIGETTKQYTQRLRLEQAAYQLKVRTLSITEIAFSLGYQSHETFTRAFQRHFGLSPQKFRQCESVARWAERTTSAGKDQSINQFAAAYSLSKTTMQEIAPLQVAFIRNYGAYLDVDVTAFDTLLEWAQVNNLYDGSNLLIGVGHDDPSLTPIDKVRFDCCLTVSGSVVPNGKINVQELSSGLHAVTTYIGPFGRILEQAYWDIFQRLIALPTYEIIGLPAIEIYRTTRINLDYTMNHTDIYIPIRRRGEGMTR